MEYVARFSQQHESFRLAELQALASVEGVELEVVSYSADTPFCVVRLSNEDAARALIRRSILAQSIGELWGDSSDTHVSSSPSKEIVCLEPSLTSAAPSDNTASGSVVAALHESVRQRSAHLWPTYGSPETSFRIDVDSFQGSRTNHERLALFEGLSFLGLRGPIRMKNPDVVFTILEHWAYDPPPQGKRITEETKRSAASAEPQRMYFVRHVAASSRHLVREYSLKTRRYVSTTSMDAELALVTANLALASDGKLFYDPFAGTGGFPIACAAFGATVFGSDIDGRAVRGTGSWGGGTERERGSKKRSVKGNFDQYGLTDRLGDLWVADLTNTPLVVGDVLDDGTGIIGADDRPILRRGRRPLFDGIACDPPYGVREGLRVLGFRDKKEDRETTDLWTNPDYIHPKRPYSFLAMLDDILDFAAATLVDGGRLAFWMPTANDEEQEIAVPTHPCLRLVVVCVQEFNKWSRRLITYERIPDAQVDRNALRARSQTRRDGFQGRTADELNPFRKGYFNKFEV